MATFEGDTQSVESSETHATTAPQGLECLITFEDIDGENYCEYQTAPSMLWHPAKASFDAIEYLRTTQFQRYMDRVQSTDCAAEMSRLLTKGPPIYVDESNCLPLPYGETHVFRFWRMRDNTDVSAVLQGALHGDERQALWDQLRSIHAAVQADDDANRKGPSTTTSSSS